MGYVMPIRPRRRPLRPCGEIHAGLTQANLELVVLFCSRSFNLDILGPEIGRLFALPWQFKGTFRGISVGYEFRIGKAKRRRYLWKRKNCQSSVRERHRGGMHDRGRDHTDWLP